MSVAFITGITGFVGQHLQEYLKNKNFEVYGLVKNNVSVHDKRTFTCDILDHKKVSMIVDEVQPELIFHLAAQSSVSYSWVEPQLTYDVSVEGTRNLFDAVVKARINPRILLVSSSEVYGIPQELPVSETHPLNPSSPYAKAKVKMEEVCKQYSLDVIISRSFNHTGPGQRPSFVCSDFAKQIVEIKIGLREPVIYVGNLDIKRDFTDVRDVAMAYLFALEKGVTGEVYNICSGNLYMIRDILGILTDTSEVDNIEIKKDLKKFNPNDIPLISGNNKKFCKQTGWGPKIPMTRTLKDLFEYWEIKLSEGLKR